MLNPRELGQLIKLAREEAGMSQGALGEQLTPRKSHAAISDIERGVTKLAVSELSQFARILGKPISYFLPGQAGVQSLTSTTYARGDAGSSPETRAAIDAFKARARLHAQQRPRG